MKSGNKEVAAKKLDDDMDAYWAKKGGEGDEAAPAEEVDGVPGATVDDAEVEDEKPAAVEAGADAEA